MGLVGEEGGAVEKCWIGFVSSLLLRIRLLDILIASEIMFTSSFSACCHPHVTFRRRRASMIALARSTCTSEKAPAACCWLIRLVDAKRARDEGRNDIVMKWAVAVRATVLLSLP